MEREFQAVSDVKDLQQNFNEIRIIRNTVMHNKTINLRAIKDIINVDTLKTMQLLGFNYKEAIGVPLTNLCANTIMNIGQKRISIVITTKRQKKMIINHDWI